MVVYTQLGPVILASVVILASLLPFNYYMAKRFEVRNSARVMA